MASPSERYQVIVDKLRKENHRLTPQRMAILKILSASVDHPSADMVYDQIRKDFPSTSFATVYKTIALAKQLGEILELEFSHDSNRYDGNRPYPHPHLICISCKKIVDPDLDTVIHLKDEISQETGFKITRHRMDFFGICPDCQE